MNIDYNKYESIIGLEVHIQLNTKSKAYCSDATTFGAKSNTNISPISLGHPGTLPKPNKKVIEYAVRLGIACECDITEVNEYARKNYFYADLPKGYQITQDTTPICRGGKILIQDHGVTKAINLTRIHMEEDSGKSIHDIDPFYSLIDLNRAGIPLLEVVSEPDFRSAEQAYQFLTELRKLVRYLNISDGNMEEGSLRCDANISIRPKKQKEFGTKVEVKNMNSMSNVKKAIEYEVKRQIKANEIGETIYQETRTWDALNSKTLVMRTKEDSHDYRYFPEPDIQPLTVTQEYIEQAKNNLPPLPNELIQKYTQKLGLSLYDAQVITETKEIALYFEELIKHTKNIKIAANWMMGSIKSYLNKKSITILEFPIKPEKIAKLISIIEQRKVSNSVATQKLFPQMLQNPESSPLKLAEDMNLLQQSDKTILREFIKQVIEKHPEKVKEYKNGKKGVLGLFMGEVMKLSKGKADPKIANKLVMQALEN